MKAISVITAFALRMRGQQQAGNGITQALSIPFRFAAGRGSILIPARINGRAALLILDTGSTHTVLRPSAVGIDPNEVIAPRKGAGIIGDAVGQVVTLEVGRRLWHRRPVAVMDLSQVLSAYQESIDGLLGIDFLLEFSQAVINLKERLVAFIP